MPENPGTRRARGLWCMPDGTQQGQKAKEANGGWLAHPRTGVATLERSSTTPPFRFWRLPRLARTYPESWWNTWRMRRAGGWRTGPTWPCKRYDWRSWYLGPSHNPYPLGVRR